MKGRELVVGQYVRLFIPQHGTEELRLVEGRVEFSGPNPNGNGNHVVQIQCPSVEGAASFISMGHDSLEDSEIELFDPDPDYIHNVKEAAARRWKRWME